MSKRAPHHPLPSSDVQLLKKLSAYSSMAAAASLALQPSLVQGQVVYTDVDPDAVVTPYFGSGIEQALDFEGDGFVDFKVDGSHGTCSTFFYGTISVTSAWITDRDPSVKLGGNVFWFGTIYGFNEGDTIGSSVQFVDPYPRFGKDPLAMWSCSWEYNYGQYPGDLFAVRMERDGQFHYGWVRLSMNDSAAASVLYDYAFEATPGASIVAGQVPALSAKDDLAEIPIGGSSDVPVLENDYAAIDKSLLGLSIVEAPTGGTVSIEPAGILRYTANPGFFGRDTLVYRVQDTAGLTRDAELRILVNDPPVAVADSANTDPGVPVTVDVLANDTDASGGLDSNSLSIVQVPLHGSAFVLGSSGIQYTPGVGQLGLDSFRYAVCDAFGTCSEANIQVRTSPFGDFGTGILLTDALSGLQVLSLGDLTGNGALDVVYGVRGENRVSAQFQQRSGIFTPPRNLVRPVDQVYDLILTPLNGGGSPDLLTQSPTDGKVYWHRNLGNRMADGIPVLTANQPHVLAVGNLDGDARLDLIVAGRDSGILSWLPDPTAPSGAGPIVLADGLFGASRIVVADLDSDGDKDLVVAAAWADRIAWMANNGSGSFGPLQILDDNALFAKDLHAADLNGDGHIDLMAAIAGANEVRVYRNLGGGFFAAPLLFATGSAPTDVETADLNGDGLLDALVVYQGDGVVEWYPNTESSGFEAPRRAASLAGVHSMAIGDLNRDGRFDLAVIGDSPDRAVWFPNQTPIVPCDVPAGLSAAVVADTSVSLSWNPVDRALGYRIRMGPDDGGMGLSDFRVFASVAPGMTVHGPFAPATTYAWSVRAACASDTSDYAPKQSLIWPSLRTVAESNSLWTVAPNPTAGHLRVRMNGATSLEPWTLELLDPSGRLLDRWQGTNTQVDLDLSRWSSGLYALRRKHGSSNWSYLKVVLE